MEVALTYSDWACTGGQSLSQMLSRCRLRAGDARRVCPFYRWKNNPQRLNGLVRAGLGTRDSMEPMFIIRESRATQGGELQRRAHHTSKYKRAVSQSYWDATVPEDQEAWEKERRRS